MSRIDVRTRHDGADTKFDPHRFLDVELPELFASERELVASTTQLDLRPLALAIGEDAWLLERTDEGVAVRRHEGPADRTLHLDATQLGDLVDDQVTPVGLFTAGTLDLRGCGIGRLLDWWLVLRSVLDGMPVHRPGSVGLPDDLTRSFTLDDDPAEIVGFLADTGFLRLRRVFDPTEMERVSRDMDDAAPRYHDGDGRSWWATLEDGSRRLVRMQSFDRHSRAVSDLLDDGRLARIREIVGHGHEPQTRRKNRIEALFKPLGVVEGISDIPWHKDCSLGRHSYDCAALTVGISVTGAGPGTGQLAVVAGSHRAHCWPSLLDVETLGLPVVPLATDTGDVTVHLSCTLHMAEPPAIAERRVLYTGATLPPVDRAAAAAARARLYEESRERAPRTTSQPS